MKWVPVEGQPLLERSEDGRYRRIVMGGVGPAARPHPTKRVMLSEDESARVRRGIEPAPGTATPKKPR